MALFDAMRTIKEIFDKHAGKDGDEKTLSKAEVADLLKKEGILTPNADKTKVEDFFNMLDADKSGSVNFEEFVIFTAALCVLCKPE